MTVGSWSEVLLSQPAASMTDCGAFCERNCSQVLGLSSANAGKVVNAVKPSTLKTAIINILMDFWIINLL